MFLSRNKLWAATHALLFDKFGDLRDGSTSLKPGVRVHSPVFPAGACATPAAETVLLGPAPWLQSCSHPGALEPVGTLHSATAGVAARVRILALPRWRPRDASGGSGAPGPGKTLLQPCHPLRTRHGGRAPGNIESGRGTGAPSSGGGDATKTLGGQRIRPQEARHGQGAHHGAFSPARAPWRPAALRIRHLYWPPPSAGGGKGRQSHRQYRIRSRGRIVGWETGGSIWLGKARFLTAAAPGGLRYGQRHRRCCSS
jgi:hypothetical protein